MRKSKSVTIASKARSSAEMIYDAARTEEHGKYEKQDSVLVESELEHEPSNISPKDFDKFIPWVCQHWSSIPVYIIRKAQDHYVIVSQKKITKAKRTKPKGDVSIDNVDESSGSVYKSCIPEDSSWIPVTTYYEAHDKLVEISIVSSPVRPTRQVIRAFSLAVPYHSSLTRFTFRRSGLTAELIYDINKLLPISNICEIILDDSYVPEGNYHILLERFSQLKYLSLNRCKVNDEVCKKIFDNVRIDAPAANTLQILELGSNEITDHGADCIGSVLRANRCLLHLNLSGNKITDNGFLKILDSLMEFPLTNEERYASSRRKLQYLQSKTAVYARCLNEIKCGNLEDVDDGSSSATKCGRKILMKRLRSKTKRSEPMRTVEDEAEIMAIKIVGEFNDPHSANDVVLKDNTAFCKGNFVLCSINIAYNNLEYASVRKLSEVLQYQEGIRDIDGKDTGLIRITLDGNRIPRICSELDDVDLYLRKLVRLRTVSEFKKRPNTLCNKKSTVHRSRQNSDIQLGM